MKTFDLTAQHIVALKKLCVFWIDVESGAPAILRPTDLVVLLAVSNNWVPELTEAEYVELDTQMQIALKFGELAPGRYCVPNRIKQTLECGLFGGFSTNLPMLRDDQICFDFKNEHRKLLAAARFSSGGINPKRPYGDMTYWEIDAAELLDMPVPRKEDGEIEFSEDQLAHLEQLHHETWPALMVFLEHMTLTPDQYGDATGYGDWQPG